MSASLLTFKAVKPKRHSHCIEVAIYEDHDNHANSDLMFCILVRDHEGECNFRLLADLTEVEKTNYDALWAQNEYN